MILSYVFDQNINHRYLEVLGKNHLQLFIKSASMLHVFHIMIDRI